MWRMLTPSRSASPGHRRRSNGAFTVWVDANAGTGYDPELFRRDILPRLQTVKLSETIEATGMSKGAASDIRRGK